MISEATVPATTGLPLAAASAERRRFASVRHSLVLAKRGVINMIRTPESLIDVTLQPIIFLLMFTYIFGGAISHGSTHAYLQYLLPGILGQTIAMGGIAIGVNLNNDISKGIFDRFRSLPIARSSPLVGAVLADIVRYATLCVVTLGFGYVLGFRAHTSVIDVVAACALAIGFALCLCWASVFVGMIARTSGSVQGIMTLIVLPLSFGSNTFVRTSTMPGWLQSFVKVNPLSHLVGAVRGLLLGGPVGSDVLWSFVSMAALLIVFVPLALRAYARRV